MAFLSPVHPVSLARFGEDESSNAICAIWARTGEEVSNHGGVRSLANRLQFELLVLGALVEIYAGLVG